MHKFPKKLQALQVPFWVGIYALLSKLCQIETGRIVMPMSDFKSCLGKFYKKRELVPVVFPSLVSCTLVDRFLETSKVVLILVGAESCIGGR